MPDAPRESEIYAKIFEARYKEERGYAQIDRLHEDGLRKEETTLARLPITFEDLDLLKSAEERNAVREKLQRYVARGEWARSMLEHLDEQISRDFLAKNSEKGQDAKIRR